tara:strand:+ start:222 stop:521 length:300 start_codon:yes stop_codon:yes gene_type:complete
MATIKNPGPMATINTVQGSVATIEDKTDAAPNITLNTAQTRQIELKEGILSELEYDFEGQVKCVTDMDCQLAYEEQRPKRYTKHFKPVCVNGVCKLKNT